MSQAPFDLQKVLFDLHARAAGLDHQLLQARKSIAALQAESALRKIGSEPSMPMEFTSQFGEDVLAWNLLGQPTSGFFIEAGAFDGYHYSVTYPFEAAGWRGLLVEAIPDRARQCAQLRKGSHVVNAALAQRGCTGNAEFWVVDDQYGGIFSYSKSTPEHLQRVAKLPKRPVSVPLKCLDELLADHHGEVDLMVLDVEGAELDALAGFDLKRFRPRMMLIEDNSLGRNPALNNFFQAQPYISVGRLNVNQIFIRNDQAEILDRVKWMSFT
jgi:FkbM family methyltransferase